MSDEIKRNVSLNGLPTFGNFENNDHEPDRELQELKPEMVLGRKYTLERQSGQGGMGVVWKAYDTVGEHPVALKFVPKDIRHKDAAMHQVKETFNIIRKLNHEHICPVHALEKDEKFGYYVVMTWLEGVTLDMQLREWQKVNQTPFPETLSILRPVAKALDHAHKQGVIHRDIKPSNIFLCRNKETNQLEAVWVIDFGLAAEIHRTISIVTNKRMQVSGTRPYMAPEQWQGLPTQNAQTDLYALGVVAYEMYSGNLPFYNPDIELFKSCVLKTPVRPIPGVSDTVNAALQKALAKNS
ncbi:MAG: serine/threonine-protein kinase, partial [Planctomycetia bacterium]|nr:serine/threonine-protein kinase [Planctomycetia bacterium]